MLQEPQSTTQPETIERWLILGSVLLALLVVSLVVMAVGNINDAGIAADRVNHTHAVIVEFDRIESSLHAAEGAHRTFLLTGDARDQEVYRQYFSAMNTSLEVSKTLVADNLEQSRRLSILEPLLKSRVDLARQTLEARGARGVDGSREVLTAAKARQDELARIRQLIFEMKSVENTRLQERDRAQQDSARAVRYTLLAGAVLDVLLLGFLFLLVRMDLQLRRKAAAGLRAMNEVLEIRVRERTAELAKSNEDLQVENMERQWAHAAMERRYRYAEMILGAVGEGIIVIGKGGSIIDLNAAAIKMLGASDQQGSGRSVGSVLVVDSGDTLATMSAVLKEGKPVVNQTGKVVRADGKTLPVRWSCHPVADAGKTVGGVLVVWPSAS